MTTCDKIWLAMSIGWWVLLIVSAGFTFFIVGRMYERAHR